jgi:alcohol dehydrogenase
MACGAVLWQVTEANIRALGERDPASAALPKYAAAGRLLADLPSDSDDAAARTALVGTLRAWVERLEVPGLSTFGMTAEHIPLVVADSPGSSMRTNPVALSDAELSAILEAAQ